MRKIFESIDFTRVGHYQSILESEGIQTLVKNLAASSIMGDVPFTEVFPELWVVNDADYDVALQLLGEHRQLVPSDAHDWVCSNCGEQVPKEFDVCWNCETNKPQNA
jgi:hypothetical protein